MKHLTDLEQRQIADWTVDQRLSVKRLADLFKCDEIQIVNVLNERGIEPIFQAQLEFGKMELDMIVKALNKYSSACNAASYKKGANRSDLITKSVRFKNLADEINSKGFESIANQKALHDESNYNNQ